LLFGQEYLTTYKASTILALLAHHPFCLPLEHMDIHYYSSILGDVWDAGANLIPEDDLVEQQEQDNSDQEDCRILRDNRQI